MHIFPRDPTDDTLLHDALILSHYMLHGLQLLHGNLVDQTISHKPLYSPKSTFTQSRKAQNLLFLP